MSWETVALASRTSSQTQTSLRPSRRLSASGSNPSTTRPRPRLSALVSACRRVSASGKRSRPTVPARKKNAPAETATIVTMSRARLIRPPPIRIFGSRPAVPFLTKAMEAKVARSARVNATSTAAGTPVTAPRSSNAAMPPVPISCAAIMRSASPGPRRMRTSPSASIARMKPRAAVRNSVIAERPR